jgi:hypothetical protein
MVKNLLQKNLSPNLYDFDDSKYVLAVSIIKNLIFLIQAGFLLVIGLNFFFNYKLSKINEEVNITAAQMQLEKTMVSKAQEINVKVFAYKNVLAEKINFSTRLKGLYEAIFPGVQINNVSLDKNETKLTVTTDQALKIALLINRFFGNVLIDKIVIESAKLNTIDSKYTVELVIVYKQL